MRTIVLIAYLVIGLIVAAVKDYLGDIGNVGDVVNLLLAIVLWPLVLLGVDFNVNIGGDNDDKGNGKNGGKNGALFWFGPTAIYARARAASLLQTGSSSESCP